MHECLDKVVASLFQLRPLHDRDQRVEGKLRLVEALISELQKFDGFGSGRRSLIHLLLTGELPCSPLHGCCPGSAHIWCLRWEVTLASSSVPSRAPTLVPVAARSARLAPGGSLMHLLPPGEMLCCSEWLSSLLSPQSESKTHVRVMHVSAKLHGKADGHACWQLQAATTR